MSNSAGRRWAVILTALGATVGAIFYPTEGDFIEQPLPGRSALAPISISVGAAVKPKTTHAHPLWIASGEDPFAPRLWEAAPPPASAETREVKTVEASDAPVEEPPPPLPYKFLGQMQNEGQRVLYLGRGEQVLLAHKGDVLENSYKVIDVTDVQVEFELIQSGLRQTLAIPTQ